MIHEIRSGIRRLLHLPSRSPSDARADADAELESYLDARVDDLRAEGWSADAARAEALRRLGGSVDQVRHRLHASATERERQLRAREQWRAWITDMRYAMRGLARAPVFTAVAILTLAIGIGATTAIFSAVNALILRPLPFRDPERLMSVSLTMPASNGEAARDDMVWSYPKFVVFRDAQTVFESASLYSGGDFNITSGEVERAQGEWVGAHYLATLGVKPAIGRDFDAGADAGPGAPAEAILSDALWRRRFSANASVVGQTIDLDGRPHTIIGVLAPWFRGLTGEAEILVNNMSRTPRDIGGPFAHQYNLVARRKANVDKARAIAEVVVLGVRVDQSFGGSSKGSPSAGGATARALDDTRLAPVIRRSLLVLLGAVTLVLLIVCANLANLLLSRAATRRREIAIRLALGAGRARLVRLFLAESFVLSFAGTAASVAIAWWGIAAMRGLNPAALTFASRMDTTSAVAPSAIRLDAGALGFMLATALLVGIVFGLVPALDASRASLTDSLTSHGDAAPAKRGSLSARRMLIVAEVALAIVLLAGSGLLIRSLANLLAVNPGFDPRNVLTMRVTVPRGALPRDSLSGLYAQLSERLGAIPGVEHVGLNSCPPLGGGYCNFTRIDFPDGGGSGSGGPTGAGVFWASPDYFAAMRIPLRRGRLFNETDRTGTPKVVLITETAARAWWPDQNPVGRRVAVFQGGFADGAEVVGVIGDVRMAVDSAPKADVYLPYLQSPQPDFFVYLRGRTDAATLGAPARRVLREIAPRFPVHDVRTMSSRVDAVTSQARFSATLLTLFGAVALALAVIGIYGVVSYLVGQRTREIGIRIALGASSADVTRVIVGEGVALAGGGALLGLAGAALLARVLRSLLFDVTPSDPATYVSIIVVVGVAASFASWLPARRAARIDPLLALKAE